jgi:hypothetical protein
VRWDREPDAPALTPAGLAIAAATVGVAGSRLFYFLRTIRAMARSSGS